MSSIADLQRSNPRLLTTRAYLLLLIGFIGWMAGGCQRYRLEDAFVESIGAEELVRYTTDLRRRQALQNLVGPLPRELWHESFVKNGVVTVKPYLKGLMVVLRSAEKLDRGIFIDPDEAPDDGSGIEFIKLTPGIYRFEEKRRDPLAPPR